LIEKPISNSIKDVTELIRVCEQKRLVLGVGYNLRFLESLVKLKELVDLGTIGKLLSIRVEAGENLARWRPSKDYRMTVSANKNLGGGPLLELSHEIDYIRWIFGEFKWVSSNLSKSSELEVDTEDCVHAFFEIENRLDKSKLIGTLNLDFFRTDKQRTCTVIGNRGTLYWNGVSGKITLVRESNLENIESYEYEQELFSTYEAEWEDFLSCVESGERPMVTGSDALQTLLVVDAIIKSSNLENRQNVVIHASRTK
jgi:predicted dehydrogenase